MAAQDTKIPAEWPKEVPVYKGEVAIAATLQAGKAFNATVKTPDNRDTVYGFYREKFGAAGWKIKDVKGFRGPLLQADKAGRTVTVEHEARGEYNYVKVAISTR